MSTAAEREVRADARRDALQAAQEADLSPTELLLVCADALSETKSAAALRFLTAAETLSLAGNPNADLRKLALALMNTQAAFLRAAFRVTEQAVKAEKAAADKAAADAAESAASESTFAADMAEAENPTDPKTTTPETSEEVEQ